MSRFATTSRSTLSLAIRSSTTGVAVEQLRPRARRRRVRRPRRRRCSSGAARVSGCSRRRSSSGWRSSTCRRCSTAASSTRRSNATRTRRRRGSRPPPRSTPARREHRVMQLPGAEFGAFRWGYTVDPPLPGLTDKPLITRDLLPLGSPGAMDLLYALDDRARPTSSTRVDRAGRPAVRRRHDLGQQRHGVRALPHAATRADHRAVRRQPPGLGAPTSVRHADPERAGAGDARRDRAGQLPDDRSAGAAGRARRRSTSRSRWCAPRRAWSCWREAATGSSTPPAAGLLNGDEAVLYAADLRADDRLDDADLVDRHRLQPRPRPPVARHAGRRRVHRDRRARAAELLQRRHRRSTPAGVRRQTPSNIRRPPPSRACDDPGDGYGEPFAYRPEDRPAMAVDGDPSTAWVVGRPVRSRSVRALEVTGDLSTDCRCCNRSRSAHRG